MASKRHRKVVERRMVERQRRDRLAAARRRSVEEQRVREADKETRMLMLMTEEVRDA